MRDDASLAWRIKELSAALDEQDTHVSDGCHVLHNASQSLASVRAKYEPLKEHAAKLSTTSTHASQVNEDLHKLITSLRVHQRVCTAARDSCYCTCTASTGRTTILRAAAQCLRAKLSQQSCAFHMLAVTTDAPNTGQPMAGHCVNMMMV